MPYRFSLTTGNIVRPIESACLNTTTGALITPMVYGPAGTAITMWNGVVEFYTTYVWPTSYTGTATNPTYSYDQQGNAFDTTNQTTAAGVSSTSAGSTVTYIMVFGNIASSKTIKLILDYSLYSAVVDAPTYYDNCGNGAAVPAQTYAGNASLTISVSTDGTNYTTYYSDSVSQTPSSTTYNKAIMTLGSFSGSNVKVKVELYGSANTEIILDQYYCPFSAGFIYGNASLNVYACRGE